MMEVNKLKCKICCPFVFVVLKIETVTVVMH